MTEKISNEFKDSLSFWESIKSLILQFKALHKKNKFNKVLQ
jgi:hypothetical protein